MKPLIITGTCKELYQCEKLLKRFGYIPVSCYLKDSDNHESGYIFINKEGEFTFYKTNPFPDYERIVSSSDFKKNYGLMGIRTCYTFKNLYFVTTLILLMTGFEMSEPRGRWLLIGLFSLNIVFHWKILKEWILKLN